MLHRGVCDKKIYWTKKLRNAVIPIILLEGTLLFWPFSLSICLPPLTVVQTPPQWQTLRQRYPHWLGLVSRPCPMTSDPRRRWWRWWTQRKRSEKEFLNKTTKRDERKKENLLSSMLRHAEVSVVHSDRSSLQSFRGGHAEVLTGGRGHAKLSVVRSVLCLCVGKKEREKSYTESGGRGSLNQPVGRGSLLIPISIKVCLSTEQKINPQEDSLSHILSILTWSVGIEGSVL